MTIRVLVVDDHAIVRDAVVHLLSLDPELLVVACAADGASGLQLAQAHQPEIVLLDIALPDADGLDLITPLRRQCPGVSILMLSMYSEPEYVAAALDRGAHGLVSKSASPEAFLSAVHRAANDEPLHDDPTPWSEREQDVLALLAEGKGNEAIARELSIRPKTVDGYIQRLMARCDLHTRVGLVQYARRSRRARTPSS